MMKYFHEKPALTSNLNVLLSGDIDIRIPELTLVLGKVKKVNPSTTLTSLELWTGCTAGVSVVTGVGSCLASHQTHSFLTGGQTLYI